MGVSQCFECLRGTTRIVAVSHPSRSSSIASMVSSPFRSVIRVFCTSKTRSPTQINFRPLKEHLCLPLARPFTCTSPLASELRPTSNWPVDGFRFSRTKQLSSGKRRRRTHDGSASDLIDLLILLRLRLRGLLVEDGLAGEVTCLLELSDRRMRWYVFLIESNSTEAPPELLRLGRVDFFTGAER